ncbi:MAG: phosphoribosylamine--glycine ligase [Gammaproteobacteria bacterium]|nr:phosphoribosylamine--glycine ligase [Gammaproteobacteria bacterium]
MKILIVGNGGREHALAWKLRRDAPAAELFATQPNPGIARLATAVDLPPSDVGAVTLWAEGTRPDLTIIGPEVPLALGLGDALRQRGLPVFGPGASAARIEASKAFAKDLMARACVPTAAHRTFTSWPEAQAYISAADAPIVVKASGLAAGKGAIVCPSTGEALAAAKSMLTGGAFGAAGSEIVVEEFMEGEELSVFALTDGHDAVLMLPSQDYKRAGEGDTGPNTGGMGSYAPVPIATEATVGLVRDRIISPVLEGLRDAGAPFRGLLYAGLMITGSGPKVVEFNCRFGDPETQALLPLMKSSLLDLMIPIARDGSISGAACDWEDGAALNTVLASAGYPGSYENGKEITLPPRSDRQDRLLVFHAGTRDTDGRLLTNGGRVLSVVGVGGDLEEARARSLAGADVIRFEGKTLRRDIGWRAFSSDARATGS